ncbi:MAG TPA: polysaccharide biosynthesis protein, partial [Gammaproteobacteria bacterium]|nr:polysaccharide biosynthesis protein [Gammaproteobacteria bacterium]
GSVIPLFREQIKAGGPITVTHAQVSRYFMSIPEAAQLVLQAGAMAKGGDVFVLDMGEPVKIINLARQMIELSGLTVLDEKNPDGDIRIELTGLRPGEKLHEELLIGNSPIGTEHPKILRAKEKMLTWPSLRKLLDEIRAAYKAVDVERTRQLVMVNADGGKSSAPSDLGDPLLPNVTGAALESGDQEPLH